jgi:hypothetical protein
VNRSTSALATLSAGEKAIVLDGLLVARPDLREIEAADEIMDEALEPFLRDLERRATLGMTTAAIELAVGVLLGLYECRDGGSETLLEYSPDYAAERAGNVVDQCAKLGIDLPRAELLDLLPAWDGILS